MSRSLLLIVAFASSAVLAASSKLSTQCVNGNNALHSEFGELLKDTPFNFGAAQAPNVKSGFPKLFELTENTSTDDIFAVINAVAGFLETADKKPSVGGNCQDSHLAYFLKGNPQKATSCSFPSNVFPAKFFDLCAKKGGKVLYADVQLKIGKGLDLVAIFDTIQPGFGFLGASILGIKDGDSVLIKRAGAYCMAKECEGQGTDAIEEYVLEAAQKTLTGLGIFEEGNDQSSTISTIIAQIPGFATFSSCDSTPYGAYELEIPNVAAAIGAGSIKGVVQEATKKVCGKEPFRPPSTTAPTDPPKTKAPTEPFSCSKLTRTGCNFLKNRKLCMWTGKECTDRAPTEYPTKAPTEPFSCSNLKKSACNFLRNRKLCMWTGKECTDRAPTQFPTARPTKEPTAFACENLSSRFCRSRKYKNKCMWTGKECAERAPTQLPTARPTKEPTPFACENLSARVCRYTKYKNKCELKGLQCVTKTIVPTISNSCAKYRSKFFCLKAEKRGELCGWADEAGCYENTARPTGSPTPFSCDAAKTLRVCRSLKFRKQCVFFNKKCVEKTQFPTKSPTVFACSSLNRFTCKYKKYSDLCEYSTKERKCRAKVTASPTDAPTEFVDCAAKKFRPNCQKLEGCKWTSAKINGNFCVQE